MICIIMLGWLVSVLVYEGRSNNNVVNGTTPTRVNVLIHIDRTPSYYTNKFPLHPQCEDLITLKSCDGLLSPQPVNLPVYH